MKKYIIALLVVLGIGLPSSALADTHAAADCERTTVLSAIAAAAAGDTVTVAAGSCNWSDVVTIDKNIILQGAGIGNTNITSTGGSVMFSYTTATPDNVNLLRITGFTMTGNGRATTPIQIVNTSTTTAMTKMRIDHNAITSGTSKSIVKSGMIYGLIDYNTIANTGNVFCFTLTGIGNAAWDAETFPLQLGSANMLYIENNIISGTAAGWIVTQSNNGSRWVLRNNAIDLTNTGGPSVDSHGNQSSDDSDIPTSCALTNNERGTVGVEVYENTFTNHNNPTKIRDFRGGTGIMFGNTDAGSVNGGIQIREEDSNAATGTCYPLTESYPGWDPIKDSYFWSNVFNTSTRMYWEIPAASGTLITEQVDYWTDTQPASPFAARAYFTKAAGTSRNLTTCTDEDVYWETDNRRLYRCNPANTWTLVYTPYGTHPLSDTPDTTPPTITGVTPGGSVSYQTTSQLSAESDEAATGRFQLASEASDPPDWDEMAEMSLTGGTTHTKTVSVVEGANSFVGLFRDANGNESDLVTWSFTVAAADVPPATAGSATRGPGGTWTRGPGSTITH